MKAVLVFLDGTVCDMRHRISLQGKEAFFAEENVLRDVPTQGSVDCMRELSERYHLIYIGARPERAADCTIKWLRSVGLPDGDVYLGEKQHERLRLVETLRERFTFAAGIGDRWDDNELHLALGCQSFILQEWKPNWDTVRKYLLRSQ